jgi:SAM-dependent methyltransferase
MGLSLNEVAILADWIPRHGLHGYVATLGVPTLHFSAAELATVLRDDCIETVDATYLHATDLYRRLGFAQASYVDVSDYEGADILFDLGSPEIPEHLKGAFDVVFDCGTLEHIFHVPNALHNVVRMTAPGGHVLHAVLMNNGVEHGFYQFSPTLFFDWFEAAGLEVLEAAAMSFDPLDFRYGTWSVRHVRRGTFGGGELGLAKEGTALFMVLAQKSGELIEPRSTIQYFYRAERAYDPIQPRWFAAFQMQAGIVKEPMHAVRLKLEGFSSDGGFAWQCRLPDSVPVGSDEEHRCSSDMLLFEDDRPLGPMNWPHETIRAVGNGAYNHWGQALYFATSDNSSPLTNGRCYEVLFAKLASKA